MSEKNVIPLFPLPLVVFPGQTLPLYIFEPRYRQMLADVRQAQAVGQVLPMGISFGQDSAVYAQVGCTVVLERVLREFGDGRLHIITVGQRRYRLKEVYQEKMYLTAAVEFFDDQAEAVDLVLRQKAHQGYSRLLELVQEEAGTHLEVQVPEGSFAMAQAAGLNLELRQKLLEMNSENLRLQALGEHFDQLVPALEARRQERQRVQANGRARKKS
jgi:ATP-dependent Lon protease